MPLSRHKNLGNLLLVCFIISLVTACFCRSDRDLGTSGNEPTAPASKSNSTSNAPPESTKTSAGKKEDDGDFIVEHLEVSTPRYKELDRQVKNEKLLIKAAAKLNLALSLPHDLYLRTKDCNETNAFYDSSDHSVTMCYELMEHFYSTFRSAGDTDQKAYAKMFDAVKFVFLHEIGHALIDAYSLPVAGNEEDAADRCAAYINLIELGDEGVRSVLAAADAFAIESKQRSGKPNMADEHLLQEQRFYNSLCMIYGSNPDKFSDIVTDGFLPKERAVRCANEFQRSVDSWVSLLEPWRKR
ncbi:MAG: DUF4344 domain-containing metallopeptidase [Pyrinomonadaceae bacterium]